MLMSITLVSLGVFRQLLKLFLFLGDLGWNLKCFSLFSASAVDGGYSDWSKFSECNASCGRGVKIRKRSCNSPEPTNGGKDCSDLGPAMESEACNSFPCRMLDFFFSQQFP